MPYGRGDELGWHFDNADFVVTLMLQNLGRRLVRVRADVAQRGRQQLRGVAALLLRDRSGVRTMSPEPGTLALFRGHLSPHRVTPVEGDSHRINSVLAYSDRPDSRVTASALRILFGRGEDADPRAAPTPECPAWTSRLGVEWPDAGINAHATACGQPNCKYHSEPVERETSDPAEAYA